MDPRRAIWVRVLWAAVLALIPCCASAVTLTGHLDPTVASVFQQPCPTHPEHSCAYHATPVTAIPTGYNAAFQSAWDAALPGEWNPSAWTLIYSTSPVDAILNIETYSAYRNPTGNCYGGSEIRVMWNPTGSQTGLEWVQAIHTNQSRYHQTNYYLDIATYREDKPPVYPYSSYPDYRFYDKPGRYCVVDTDVFWDAYTYLAVVDSVGKTCTLYDGFRWGFTIDSAVPEPGAQAALILGLIALAPRFRARRNPRA